MTGPVERRFLTAYREADTDEPGLIQEDDGTIWRVKPDGTRVELTESGGSQTVLTASKHLTTAQILALHDTPIQIVAAPGVGKVLLPHRFLLVASYGGTPWDIPGGQNYLGVDYVGDNQPAGVPCAVDLAAMFDGANPQSGGLMALSDGEASWNMASAIVTNAALVVAAHTSNPTGGNGSMDVYLTYDIVTL